MQTRAILAFLFGLGIGCDVADDPFYDAGVGSTDGAEEYVDQFALVPPVVASIMTARSFTLDGHFEALPELYNTRAATVETSGRITAVATHQRPVGMDTDALVTRVDFAGNLQWVRRYGSLGVSLRASSAVEATNGDVVIAGSADGLPLRFKLDSAGTVLWAYQEQGLGVGDATVVVRTGSDYLMAGHVEWAGSTMPFATKFAEDGTLLWSRRLDDWIGLPVEHRISDVFDAGSMLYLVGTRRNVGAPGTDSTQSLFIMKVDPIGGVVLQVLLYPHNDPVAEQALFAPTMVKTTEGFAVGYSVSVEGEGKRPAVAWLDANLDPLGETQYHSVVPPAGDSREFGLSLFAAEDGGLDLSVAFGERPGLIRLDSSGDVISSLVYGFEAANSEHVEGAVAGPEGYVLTSYDFDAMHLAGVDHEGRGACEADHEVVAVPSEINLQLIPFSTAGPSFWSLTYPVVAEGETVLHRSTCS